MKRSSLHSLMTAVLITIAAPAAGNAQDLNLTGLWKDDTGNVVYRLRQVDNRVFWTVDGTTIGRYANFAYGDISGSSIAAMWIDMPGSPALGWGYITLRIDSNDRLVKIAQSANYRGSVWTRVGATTPTPGGAPTCNGNIQEMWWWLTGSDSAPYAFWVFQANTWTSREVDYGRTDRLDYWGSSKCVGTNTWEFWNANGALVRTLTLRNDGTLYNVANGQAFHR